MNAIDYVIIAIVLLIIGGSVGYIISAKKRGQKCVGCPYSKTCSGGCSTCSGDCGEKEENKEK